MSISKVQESQDPSKLMHDSIFEISRPQPMKHSRFNDNKDPKQKVFEDVRKQTLQLIYGDKFNPNTDFTGGYEDSLMMDSIRENSQSK